MDTTTTQRKLRNAARAIGRNVVVEPIVGMPDGFTMLPGMFLLTMDYDPQRPSLLQQLTSDLQRTLTQIDEDADAAGNAPFGFSLMYGAPCGYGRIAITIIAAGLQPDTDAAPIVRNAGYQVTRAPRTTGGVPTRQQAQQQSVSASNSPRRRLKLTMENIEKAQAAIEAYVKTDGAALLHTTETLQDVEWDTSSTGTDKELVFWTHDQEHDFNGKYYITLDAEYNVIEVVAAVDHDVCHACDMETLEPLRDFERGLQLG
jgi:hypothetical protein